MVVEVRTSGHLAPGMLQTHIFPTNCIVRTMSYPFGRYQKEAD